MHNKLQKWIFFPLIFIRFTLFENRQGAAMDPLAGRVFEVPGLRVKYENHK